MGSPPNEKGRSEGEGPIHEVTIGYSLAVGKYEVTFLEWDACVSADGCNGYAPSDNDCGRGARPVINVSWDDAKSYVSWLSRETGQPYRLLSESEREYVARAGTSTAYWWGDEAIGSHADCLTESQFIVSGTAPVGRFLANGFGLHDLLGNTWEWTEDCIHENYRGAPSDGSAWTSGGECSLRVFRGGFWFGRLARSAHRGWHVTNERHCPICGLRVARTLP